MNTGEVGIGQIEGKINCKDFNGTFPIDTVKCEPPETDIFMSASTCNIASSADSDKCQEQNEEKPDVKNLIPRDLDHTNFFVDLPSIVRIKNDNFDICYTDIKRETGDEKSSERINFCEVCHQSFDGETELLKSTSFRLECSCQKQNESLYYNINIDDKPFSFDLAKDSELSPPVLQDETISGDELTVEQDSSASPPMKNYINRRRKSSSKSLANARAKKKIQCKICSKSFNRIDNFKVHERSHTGEKPFSCEICLRAFTNASQLIVHGRVHTGEKPFHCEICSKSFSQMITLKIHVRSHTGEKPYHCKICSKAFSNLSGVTVHEKRGHPVEKFECKVCSESFSQRNTLKVHLRSHTGEKLYQCKICSKEFIKARGLRVHRKIHTGEKPFNCKICSKSFGRKAYLKVHERSHTGERPFFCEICFKRFAYSSGLKGHLRIHAGENSSTTDT